MKRKKCKVYGLLVVLMLSIICGLSACQKRQVTESKTKEKLPEIRIGVDMLKPFFYIDKNGDYKGIDAEIAKKACKLAGYQPKFINISWSDRDEYLENGQVDCLWSAFCKDGREEKYLWTDTYLNSKLKAIVEERCPSKNFEDFKGPSGIAMRAGSKIEEIIESGSDPRFENMDIYCCGTFEMAQTAFVKGYADALAGHEVVLDQMIEENPGLYRYLDGTILNAQLGVAFKLENGQKMCEKINEALKEMKKDGTIAEIAEKYGLNMTDTEEVKTDGEE